MSPNTQHSYRDALRMLLPFISTRVGKELDLLEVCDISADVVRSFLTHVDEQRKVTIQTRNQRLAAIHSLARFIAELSPQHVAWYGGIRTVPSKERAVDSSRIWRNQKSKQCWPYPILPRLLAIGTTRCCCSCITRELGPVKQQACALLISTLARDQMEQRACASRGKEARYDTVLPGRTTAQEFARLIEGRFEKDRGVSESPWKTTHAVWHICDGEGLRRPSRQTCAVTSVKMR
jgi:hypothetical protein